MLFKCIEACKNNCRCIAIAKETTYLDGQLCERYQKLSHVGVSFLANCLRSFRKSSLGFLVVGHIHEDINESFRYLSKKLRMQNNYVMANFMKALMLSQDHPCNSFKKSLISNLGLMDT